MTQPTQVTSNAMERPSSFVYRTRQFYLLLAGLFAVGIVVQVFFAGLGVLVAPSYFGWHTTFAHMLEFILLVMLIVGLLGRVGWRSFGLNALLFVVFGMQYFFMYGLQGPLRALHVVNALALFWLALQLAQGSWRLIRTSRTTLAEGAYAPGGKKGSVGRSIAGGIAILLGAVVLFGVIFDNGPGLIGSGRAPSQGEPSEVDASTPIDMSAIGNGLYTQNCAGCHGQAGTGGFGPALAGNEALADDIDTVEQILGGGGGMPAFNRLSDAEVAAVATHVRSSWGNNFGPVSVGEVELQR